MKTILFRTRTGVSEPRIVSVIHADDSNTLFSRLTDANAAPVVKSAQSHHARNSILCDDRELKLLQSMWTAS